MLVCLIMSDFLSVWKKGEKSELGWIMSLNKQLLFRLSNKDKGENYFN